MVLTSLAISLIVDDATSYISVLISLFESVTCNAVSVICVIVRDVSSVTVTSLWSAVFTDVTSGGVSVLLAAFLV